MIGCLREDTKTPLADTYECNYVSGMNSISKFGACRSGDLAVALLLAAAMPGPSAAAELVMFTREGCPWCARWDREIAPIYPATPEGRTAPLRRVDIDRPQAPKPALTAPVVYTPTFVLIDSGREVGRIVGYSGDDAFWGLLGKLLAQVRETGLPPPLKNADMK